MATVLNVDSAIPGRLAANQAPRLAAVLMAAFHHGEAVKVTAHAVDAAPAVATLFSPGDPLSRWVLASMQPKVAPDAPNPAPGPAPQQQAPGMAPAASAPLSPITSIYRRLLGEVGGTSRFRSADEVIEAERPVPAGQTAAAARHEVEPEVDRETELVRLAAMVVASGFGVPMMASINGGEFEATLLRNIALAADVIAPRRPLAGLAPVALQAIVASSVHSSTASFLEDLGRAPAGVPGVPRQLSDVAKGIPDGGKVAGQFMHQGQFSVEKFLQAAAGMSMHASQVLGATPMGIKLALFSAAAQKASMIVQQVHHGARDRQSEGRMQLGLGKMRSKSGRRQDLVDHDAMHFEDSPKPFGA